ncbi:MAG: hypothetical protein Q4F95_07760 [Oscillospiraceae bacterium]|nr:hypothetical protein [Oscillospiraceae bacterium]
MKRLFVPLLMIGILFMLSGCLGGTTKQNAKTTLNSSFTCDMKMLQDDSEYCAVISRIGPGAWEAEFTSPETLSGVKLSFMDSEVTASYKGLAFSIPKSAMPVKSILTYFVKAADDLALADGYEGTVKDGVMTVKGNLDEGEYEMKFDEKTGNLLAFIMDNLKVTMDFTNMNITNQNNMNDQTDISSGDSAQTQPQEEVTSALETSGEDGEVTIVS